jgi:hypothetical protein
MLALSSNNIVKYVACFFVASGTFPTTPQLIAWTSNNFGGSMKRSTSIAVTVMSANLAGVSSSFIYLPKMAPQYRAGHLALMGLLLTAATVACIMRTYFRKQNAKREAIKPSATYTKYEKLQQSDRGEDADFFRFIT